MAGASAWLGGRRVLVTGAAGSVGWPLARALANARPAALVLVDHHEHSLFTLERSLGAASTGLVYELLDVRDTRRLSRLFESHRPEVVFHLAAAKHVPYGERFPEGVVDANVLATAALLRLAHSTGTETVVYPSSDKSVAPPSLYGATKRLGEGQVQWWATAGRRGLVVRFVNIIGTRGSVIETFVQQVLAGRPLSVTDERMTRFWITLQQGVDFVFDNFKRMHGGEIFVPKIPSSRITDLADAIAPGLPHKVIGIRPGEKLHEVMCPRDDYHLTVEFPQHYVIKPSIIMGFQVDYATSKTSEASKPVVEDFEYSSGTNPHFLSVAEIRHLLEVGA